RPASPRAGPPAVPAPAGARYGAWRSSLGDRYVVENATDDDLRRDLLRIRFVRDDEPVPHDVERHGFDVVGQDVIAAVEERLRTGREGDVDRGARRDAVGDQGFQVRELRAHGVARGDDDADDVVLDRLVHVHLTDGGARIKYGRGGRELPRDRGLLDGVAIHDHPLLVGGRVTDDDLHHESVDL